MKAAKLAHRALLSLKGPETQPFLQGLLTKDLNALDTTQCVYSFLLNAKGRIVSDLMIYKPRSLPTNDELLLEMDAHRLDEIERLLKLYRLRKKVDITRSSTDIFFVFPSIVSLTSGVDEGLFNDPRVGHKFGSRFLGSVEETSNVDEYTRWRLEWGIGEGEELENQLPLNVNGDFLNAVSFDKGCYIGQELIARTHHTGVIRSRLLPFKSSVKTLKQNSTIVDVDGKRRGKIIKFFDGYGISIVSVDGVLSKHKFLSENGDTLEFSIPKYWPQNSQETPFSPAAPLSSG